MRSYIAAAVALAARARARGRDQRCAASSSPMISNRTRRVCAYHERALLDGFRRVPVTAAARNLRGPQEMAALFADVAGGARHSSSISLAAGGLITGKLARGAADKISAAGGVGTEGLPCTRQAARGLTNGCASSPARPRPALSERLRTELDVICQMGFCRLLSDRRGFHPLGRRQRRAGRTGPAARRRLAWSPTTRLTDLDPLKYDLLFEPFLNPEHVMRTDVGFLHGRATGIEYVAHKYGRRASSQDHSRRAPWPRRPSCAMSAACSHELRLVDRIAKLFPSSSAYSRGRAREGAGAQEA